MVMFVCNRIENIMGKEENADTIIFSVFQNGYKVPFVMIIKIHKWERVNKKLIILEVSFVLF